MSPDGPDLDYRERLGCGTAVADLLAQVADSSPPPDPAHQRWCPECQAQLAELTVVWEAVHRLAREQVVVPPLFEAGVRRRIIQASAAGRPRSAVATPRPRAWVPIASDARGTTRVGDTILARLARLAARSVGGVRVAPVSRSGGGASVSEAGGQVVVSLRLELPYGEGLVAAAEAVRMAVVVQLFAVTGLQGLRVDITIVGLTG